VQFAMLYLAVSGLIMVGCRLETNGVEPDVTVDRPFLALSGQTRIENEIELPAR
jgi:hypothetical protein